MLHFIVINLLAVLIAIIASCSDHRLYRKPFAVSFLIVFLLYALRYDFGNDYMNYYQFFNELHRLSFHDLLINIKIRSAEGLEIGYSLLNRLLPSFYFLIALLSFFACLAYYLGILKYVPQKYIWFSLFLLLFNPELMLIQASSLRQTVAIVIFFVSIQYLIDRNFLKYSLLIILASFFHISSIILLPVYFLTKPNAWKRGLLYVLIGCFLFITFFGYTLLGNIEYITSYIFPFYEESYMIDIVGSEINTGLGIVFIFIIFIIIIWGHNKAEPRDIVISKLSLIGLVLYPLGLYLMMFERIYLYFSPFLIITIPVVISKQKNWQVRVITISVVILFYLYSFYGFLQNPVWKEKYSTYKTILTIR